MSRQLLEQLVPKHWEDKPDPGAGFQRVRWLQNVSDLVDRPVKNRVNASTNATAVVTNGLIQSSGIGSVQIQPKRYAELTVKARITFNLNSIGPAYVYVYRTTGAIPANGGPPGAADVIVGGDAFAGGPMTAGVNQIGAFSFLDTGLDVKQKYSYYLAVSGPNGNTLNLLNSSQLLVLERA